MTEPKTIKASELNEDATIVDVRTTIEHQTQHLMRPHDNIPLDQLDPKNFAEAHGLDEDSDIYILCRSGARAKTAAEKFEQQGYKNAYIIEGGIIACEQQGESLFTAHNDNVNIDINWSLIKKLPLERQVFVSAGLLVVLGNLLGAFGHSIFHLISLFVGAGLVYAGISGKCGMATLLAKAPWNQAAGSENKSAGSCSFTASSCSIKKPAEDKKPSEGGCA